MDEIFLKLTDTTYKLLEYFPDKDPLKIKTKERVLSIMENLILIDEIMGVKTDPNIQSKILADIEIVLGCFEIAKNNNWISSINYLIIYNEYKKVKNRIRSVAVKSVKPKIEKIQKVLEPEKPSQNIILSDRQKKILDFLKEREKAQVMDLQQVLPNVTKRTIRRDLEELLNNGQIIRMGEFNQVFYKINI